MNAGASREAVTKAHIESVPIVVPAHTVLEKFQIIIGPWFRRVENNTVQNRRLSSIRDLLLPKLLSGEIRVQQAEQLVRAAV
jgi:type I restriction enzyme, S subunit